MRVLQEGLRSSHPEIIGGERSTLSVLQGAKEKEADFRCFGGAVSLSDSEGPIAGAREGGPDKTTGSGSALQGARLAFRRDRLQREEGLAGCG